MPDRETWVFGYGSLMWNPCFPCTETGRAILRGWHRTLCILSVLNRGTPQRPGLALGLDRGGSCSGLAFRIPAEAFPEAKIRLWEREMARDAYRPRILPIRLEDGRRVPALVFVARPEHPQYAGHLTPEQTAELVVQGVGTAGTSLDYLRNVVRHLDASGLPDGPLHAVLALAEELAGSRVATEPRELP